MRACIARVLRRGPVRPSDTDRSPVVSAKAKVTRQQLATSMTTANDVLLRFFESACLYHNARTNSVAIAAVLLQRDRYPVSRIGRDVAI